jgi:TonB family protein
MHLAMILAVTVATRAPREARGEGQELRVAIISGTHLPSPSLAPIAEPKLQLMDPVSAQAPKIEIAAATPAFATTGISDILPPRPDPASPNPSPQLPAQFANSSCSVALTVDVAPNGQIADDRVARSCGEPMLDQMAASFAKTKWHFRPATQAGKAVADWTTVLISFVHSQ